MNRSQLAGIVNLINLDVIVVTETWFDVGTSDKLIKDTFGEDFIWFGMESDDQKSYSGSGGIGILCRKKFDNSSLVKFYKNFQALWIKSVCGSDIYYIYGIYIPPMVLLS